MAVWDQLDTSVYNQFLVTYSGDVFATASATPDGNGGYTMAPATGTNWTQDTSVVGGGGSAEQVSITVLDDTAGILEFDILQANGNTETIYGQVIGWNGWIIGFQAYQNYDPNAQVLSGAVPGVPYFYISDAPLGAGGAPVDGTNVNATNTQVPSFLDPQFPPDTQPLLLNNSGGIAPVSGDGTVEAPYNSLVGLTLSSDNVSVIGEISQDPGSLTITAVASPLTETFSTAFGSQTVTVVNAFNDAQVVELQYTQNGATVYVYGKLIGQYDDAVAGDGALLFQTYGSFDQATGAVTHTSSDASMPYILLSEQSLAATGGMPAITANGDENSFGLTANPGVLEGVFTPFGLGPGLLNLDDTLLGKTFSSDLFETTTAASDGVSSHVLRAHVHDKYNWTNSSVAPVGGGGTEEQVTVSAVYDAYQVVRFDITGGPNGPQTVYGQVLGWNSLEIGFQAYSSFDPSTGVLSGTIGNVPDFALAEAASVVDGLNLDPGVNVQNTVEQPFFLDPATPSTNLDLSALNGTSFDSANVSIVGAVQQDPTTLALNALATDSNTTFAGPGAGQFTGGQPGSLQIANVYNQYQTVEIQYVDASNTVYYDQFAKVIGYNADSLLLQVLGASGEFDPTTGAWTPIGGNESNPFLIISDNSLSATNGLPSDNVFTSNGLLPPLGTATLCFCAGTLIATPTGETEVERLQVGDSVMTHRGVARRIVWIGSGQVMVTRGRRSAATPVIVRKSALADNVPHQDLHVTKGHSFYIDDVLIPVEFLVNHRSIIWDDMAQEVTIYHVELDTHDVLLANGAPAESYRDDGNRWLFRNANRFWHLPPKDPYAPVLTGGPAVDAAWRRLLDRAGPRPGLALTDDPDLHLLADGHRIDAVTQDDLTSVFELPESFQSIRICSRSAVPAELGLARDPRELGVALQRIVLRRGTWFFTIRANDPALTNGFHDFEGDRGIRWTNGDAELPATHLKQSDRPTELVLVLGGIAHYVDDGFPAVRAA